MSVQLSRYLVSIHEYARNLLPCAVAEHDRLLVAHKLQRRLEEALFRELFFCTAQKVGVTTTVVVSNLSYSSNQFQSPR